MTFNELCTNTTKFGALSMPDGRVAISWVVDENKRVKFIWQEHGGPTVDAPTRQSFGTRLIETLGKQLRGNVKLATSRAALFMRSTSPWLLSNFQRWSNGRLPLLEARRFSLRP